MDLKTGIVRSKSGTRICKYNPDSPFTDFAIMGHINKECNPNKGSWHGGTKGYGNAGGSMGNFYGGGGGGGMGSFYGHSDDKGGGFWG